MSYTRIHQCTTCGTQNRIPAAHLADVGRCAVCKTSLEPTAEPLSVDATAFDDIVGSARVPVLVDFWAEWCGPCRMAAPEVHKAAHNLAGRAIVLKVNTEEHPDLAARFDVSAIPNFVVINKGQTVVQQPGLVDHRTMQGWVEQVARSAA